MKNKPKRDMKLFYQITEKLQHCHIYNGNGNEYATSFCPFHTNTNTPAFFVYPDWYKCSSCNAQGPLSKLWVKLSGEIRVSHTTTKTNLGIPPWRSWIKQYGDYEAAALSAHKTAVGMPSLIGYLKKRKISEFTELGKFGWIGGWLSFPVMDEFGDIVDWTLRAHPSKHIVSRYVVRPRLSKNEPHHLYVPDWKRFQEADTVHCCFGIIDSWALYAAGFASCTGISGKSIDPKLFEDVRKNIKVVPDMWEEEAGMKLVHGLGWRGELMDIDYPSDCKDASDILTLHSVEKLQEIMK